MMNQPVVSYDVFDTAVTRAFAHPRDLYVHLGDRLVALALIRCSGMEFAEARWTAELGARSKSPWTEFLFTDIYRELKPKFGWTETTAERVMAIELEIESQHLRSVPQMPERLAGDRSRAGRLVFLSDMYLPAAALRPWLERERVCTPEDLLLISGEVRGNKSSGKLFVAAREKTGGEFTRWHHTGDHSFADVASPRRLGITATHYTAAHLTARERAIRNTEGEFAVPWRSLLAGAMRLARLECGPTSPREQLLWETGTSVAGPLFYGFVRWTLAEAERRGIRRLYFLARDGEIFCNIARLIQARSPGPVECHYLYASRLVFGGPAESTTPRSLRELAIPPAQFHSLRQALVQLGLDEGWAVRNLPPEFAALNPDANLPLDARERLADWLLAPERATEIQSAIQRRAHIAREYLKSVGCVAGTPIGVVDTGWFGAIHRNLEYILGASGRPEPLTGFYLGLRPQTSPAAGELLGYTNTFSPLPLVAESSHRVLIELFSQSEHGQVIGFKRDGDRFEPLLHDAGPIHGSEIQLFRAAITAFVRRMNDVATTAAPPEAELAGAVIGLYRNFHDHPSREEAELFGFLPHADQAFEQQHTRLCTRLDWTDAILTTLNRRPRPPHWWIQGQAALGQHLWLRTYHRLRRLRWKLAGRVE